MCYIYVCPLFLQHLYMHGSDIWLIARKKPLFVDLVHCSFLLRFSVILPHTLKRKCVVTCHKLKNEAYL
jgi:hypothetical protein